MPSRPSPAPLPYGSDAPARLIGRFFFGASALAALGSGAALALLAVPVAAFERDALLAAIVAFALLCGAAYWASRRSRFRLRAALLAVALTGILLCGGLDLAFDDGARSPTIGFCALAVCLTGALIGSRWSAAVGAVAGLQLAGVASLHRGTGIAPLPGTMPVELALTLQALVILCSIAGGALIAHLIDHYLATAAEREQRFRGLLRIAADWYWEQDRNLRFSLVSEPSTADAGASPVGWVRRTLWQIPEIGLSDAELDTHRADLESRQPFGGLLAWHRDARGDWRAYHLSGEPKWDAEGVFNGYWGVARDVTAELRSRRALHVSETRYRELFSRAPSPFVLHRRGIVLDANEAAARLFGFDDPAAMTGFDCMELFPPGEARRRAQGRLGELEKLPLGGALPIADAVVRSRDGRWLSLQATAVRVEIGSATTNLSIFFDITARQAAEVALRRSEAMLSHLFATSPDGIALAEVPSGRFAMVNPAFCRLTGHAAQQVVGRTGLDLGLWHDPHDAETLMAQLEHRGSVTDFAAIFVSKSGAQVSMRLAAGRFRMDAHDYLVLTARDVTASDRTRLEHAAILERASIGIAFTREREVVQANPYFEAMFGSPGIRLAGQPDIAVWPSDGDLVPIGELAAAALADGRAFEIERSMRRPDGSRFWCRLMAQAVDLDDPVRSGTIWIAEDMSERHRLDQALAAARDAAETANLAKSAFLANTNHEIRTPLNGLLGLAQLALQPETPEPRRQEYLVQILQSARGLAGIMSDILDVSKIEAGQMALDPVPFDLREILKTVHRAHLPQAEIKGVALHLHIEPSLPGTVRGDPGRLRQILDNFVINALKFTEYGKVALRAAPAGRDEIRFTVTDTGPGLDPAIQERLFTAFSQADSSTTRRFGGTGLGLTICRELAQLMGGRVGVASAPGDGSSFWAELPLPQTDPLQSTEADDIARLAGRRVLIVEDNPVNMMICVAMLEQWQLRVVQGFDGRMAIDAVHQAARDGEPFDAVLMDVQMPVMSGHEATRQLRRHFPSPRLPIIALTAAALVSEREEALRAGMDDFLTKPIDATRLRQTLARRMAG